MFMQFYLMCLTSVMFWVKQTLFYCIVNHGNSSRCGWQHNIHFITQSDGGAQLPCYLRLAVSEIPTVVFQISLIRLSGWSKHCSCCQRVVSLLSACCQRVISVLSSYCQRVVSMLSACCQRVVSVLSACCQRAVRFCQCVVSVLSTCYQLVVSNFLWYQILEASDFPKLS